MAKYIHCEECNKRMAASAAKYKELYEFVEGIAIRDMFCDGGCHGGSQPANIKKGDKCFAALLLDNRDHPNYKNQRLENWAAQHIKINHSEPNPERSVAKE